MRDGIISKIFYHPNDSIALRHIAKKTISTYQVGDKLKLHALWFVGHTCWDILIV